jgi:hypothetical protein
MRLGDSGKIPAQPLRPRLTDMQCDSDGPHRRNTVSCQVSREHGRGALAERISRGPTVTRAGCNLWHLPVVDDHHQEFI